MSRIVPTNIPHGTSFVPAAPVWSHLRHSEHLAATVLDRHTEQRLCAVASAGVHLLVKPRVLAVPQGAG